MTKSVLLAQWRLHLPSRRRRWRNGVSWLENYRSPQIGPLDIATAPEGGLALTVASTVLPRSGRDCLRWLDRF